MKTTWKWVERIEAMGYGYDAYINESGTIIRQVWDDGYVEEYECA